MTGPQSTAPFRLAYVPGVTPGKWVRTWKERLPDVPLDLVAASEAGAVDALRAGEADAALVRLPIDRTGLSAIPLYTETTVVVVPKDHEASAVDEVSLTDLTDYIVLHPLDDSLEWPTAQGGEGQPAPGRPPGVPAKERPATVADAIELVAAGVGLLYVPQSLARLHHRKDLTYRPVLDAPQSQVALSWPQARTTELMEEFIGIVRGRTVNSSRGRTTTPPAPPAAPKKHQRQGDDAGGARRKPTSGGSKAAGTNAAKRGNPRRRSS